MPTAAPRWICAIVALAAFAAPASGYQITDRWTATATNSSTGPRGTPVTVTWGIVDDGTPVSQGGNSDGSGLVAFMDDLFNHTPPPVQTDDYRDRPWFFIFQDSFDRLSELGGVTYVYEPNDDARVTGTAGRLGTRGDVRITGKSLGEGSTSLAVNFFPNHSDMVLNTDKGSFFDNTPNNYRGFRNVVMHEALHGLGVTHVESSDGDFLMDPIIQTHFDGPQIDEVLAMHRNYGDRLEKGGNDSASDVTALPPLAPGGVYRLGEFGSSKIVAADQVDFVSIDGSSDADFYRFSLSAPSRLSLSMTPRGPSYMQGPQDGTQTLFNAAMQNDLSLTLLASNGTTVLNLSNTVALGGSEYVGRMAAAGTYVVRVVGDRDQAQLYGLQLAAAPSVTEVVWTGSQNNDWEIARSPNFAAEGAATPFFNQDRVSFIDNFAPKIVDLNADVSPESITVNTTGRYIFQGLAAIIAGSLTKQGSGEVELANSGNSYAGPTVIGGGQLLISGDANAMVSPITVAADATLLMDASDAATMASTFEINPGGTLQIGRATSAGNAFPDAPTSVLNNGTIRVFDDEGIANVVGAGSIIVEHETTTLGSGNTFTGQVIVRDGSTVRGGAAMPGGVVVNSGGFLTPGEGVGALAIGEFTLDAGATLGLEIGGVAQGTFDQLLVANGATLAGLLDVSLVGGFVPQVGQSFDILTAESLSGDFSNLDLPMLSPLLGWEIAYGETAVRLSVVSAAYAADFDQDGDVDGEDLSRWQTGFGNPGDASTGDSDQDLDVDGDDFLAWQRQLGSGVAASLQAVPEPTALPSIFVGFALLALRNQGRRW
ncbi:MAG: pre-peptidase C-terminal domain-containing protein [Pirellulales bacterium]|nr:pre-peptidase C-terminal domain-containing protein [Pirellulales bacterium]